MSCGGHSTFVPRPGPSPVHSRGTTSPSQWACAEFLSAIDEHLAVLMQQPPPSLAPTCAHRAPSFSAPPPIYNPPQPSALQKPLSPPPCSPSSDRRASSWPPSDPASSGSPSSTPSLGPPSPRRTSSTARCAVWVHVVSCLRELMSMPCLRRLVSLPPSVRVVRCNKTWPALLDAFFFVVIRPQDQLGREARRARARRCQHRYVPNPHLSRIASLSSAHLPPVRMNFSHGSYEYHQSVIDNTRKMVAGTPAALSAGLYSSY